MTVRQRGAARRGKTADLQRRALLMAPVSMADPAQKLAHERPHRPAAGARSAVAAASAASAGRNTALARARKVPQLLLARELIVGSISKQDGATTFCDDVAHG